MMKRIVEVVAPRNAEDDFRHHETPPRRGQLHDCEPGTLKQPVTVAVSMAFETMNKAELLVQPIT